MWSSSQRGRWLPSFSSKPHCEEKIMKSLLICVCVTTLLSTSVAWSQSADLSKPLPGKEFVQTLMAATDEHGSARKSLACAGLSGAMLELAKKDEARKASLTQMQTDFMTVATAIRAKDTGMAQDEMSAILKEVRYDTTALFLTRMMRNSQHTDSVFDPAIGDFIKLCADFHKELIPILR